MYTVIKDDFGHQTKKINIQTGFHFREAYRYALKTLNEEKITFGFNVSEDVVSTDDITRLIRDKILFRYFLSAKPIVSPVEPYSSFKLSLMTEPLKIPTVSYGEGSNDGKAPVYIFRAIPIDEYKLSAVVAIVKQMRWNYVAMISSNGKSGEGLAKEFAKHAYESRICYARSVALSAEPTIFDYQVAIREAVSSGVNGLIMFTNNRDSIGLAMAMKKLAVKGKFQIIAASGFANYIEVTRGNEEYLEGAISLEYSSNESAKFRDYFLALKVDLSDEASMRFWEETFSCQFRIGRNSITRCTGKEELAPGRGYYPNTPINPILNSVFSLGYAIRSFIKKQCSLTSMDPPCHIRPITSIRMREGFFNHVKEFLSNNSYPDKTIKLSDSLANHDRSQVAVDIYNYVKNGSAFESRKVGLWMLQRNASNFSKDGETGLQVHRGTLKLNTSNIHWVNSSGIAVSSCRLPCMGGHVRAMHPDKKISHCCWTCVRCTTNSVSVNGSCVDCGGDAKPDARKRQCVALAVRHFSNDENSCTSVWVYIGLSSTGILSTLLVLIIFIKNNGNIVVTSLGREIYYVILAGICLLFLVPLTFMVAPSSMVCSVRYLLPGFAFCTCYSALFLKINRIYRVFIHAQSSTARPQSTSPHSQLIMITGFVCVQLALGIVWVISEVPKAVKAYHKDDGYVLHSCSNDALPLILNLILSVGLMCSSTWYAFKTRNFPKNYNEAKYIGFTLYASSLCWALFLPTFFISTSDGSHVHEHLRCVLVIVVAFISLVGLFGQRVQMLTFPTKAQRQRNFSQLSKQEANQNQVQMKTHSLKVLSLPRTVRESPAKSPKNPIG